MFTYMFLVRCICNTSYSFLVGSQTGACQVWAPLLKCLVCLRKIVSRGLPYFENRLDPSRSRWLVQTFGTEDCGASSMRSSMKSSRSRGAVPRDAFRAVPPAETHMVLPCGKMAFTGKSTKSIFVRSCLGKSLKRFAFDKPLFAKTG